MFESIKCRWKKSIQLFSLATVSILFSSSCSYTISVKPELVHEHWVTGLSSLATGVTGDKNADNLPAMVATKGDELVRDLIVEIIASGHLNQLWAEPQLAMLDGDKYIGYANWSFYPDRKCSITEFKRTNNIWKVVNSRLETGPCK